MSTLTITDTDLNRTEDESAEARSRTLVAIYTGHHRGVHDNAPRFHLHEADLNYLVAQGQIRVTERAYGASPLISPTDAGHAAIEAMGDRGFLTTARWVRESVRGPYDHRN